jgi:hypothetical protein
MTLMIYGLMMIGGFAVNARIYRMRALVKPQQKVSSMAILNGTSLLIFARVDVSVLWRKFFNNKMVEIPTKLRKNHC